MFSHISDRLRAHPRSTPQQGTTVGLHGRIRHPNSLLPILLHHTPIPMSDAHNFALSSTHHRCCYQTHVAGKKKAGSCMDEGASASPILAAMMSFFSGLADPISRFVVQRSSPLLWQVTGCYFPRAFIPLYCDTSSVPRFPHC